MTGFNAAHKDDAFVSTDGLLYTSHVSTGMQLVHVTPSLRHQASGQPDSLILHMGSIRLHIRKRSSWQTWLYHAFTLGLGAAWDDVALLSAAV